MNRFKNRIRIALIVLVCVISFSAAKETVFSQSSTNYQITKSVIDQSGGGSQSTNYEVKDAVGQPSPVGEAISTNHIVFSGFLDGGITITVVEENKILVNPDNFKLCQNYPNPFNPETTIEFWVKEPCNVVLKLYDLLGQEVTRLINKQSQPGKYQFKFIANGLPSGVYFYRIDMGNYRAVRKMVLLE
jgi:hypothetical protein